ncbi:MAG: STAS domain-containing protein [Gemmataceae bacterium]|nr:STAS domain-containing protein [Gemmataceae bacterium]
MIQDIGPELDRLVQENAGGRLDLDLDRVEYVTGAGLGKIVVMNRRVKAAGGQFSLRNVNDFADEILRITRLDRLIDVRRKLPTKGITRTAAN